jgi:hypothetical protein
VLAVTAADLQRFRDALHALPPDLPRDTWVKVGMAAHDAGLSFDDFDAWSSGGATYNQRAARDVWRSFKDTPGGVGAGTLIKMAQAEGWGPSPTPTAWKPPARPVQTPKPPPLPGMSAAEVWARCVPADASHPYIEAKKGTAAGLRVVPEGDPLRVAGLPMAGALVVPVLPLGGGEPVSLQFIAGGEQAATWKAAGKPSKLNLPGHPVDGAFIVGDVTPGGTVYLCEGIGQSWACWRATGAPAVVCFGWGRVRAVALALRERDASARLVLVPDVGKEAGARAIAPEVGAAVVEMPEGWPANSDVNDLAQHDGFDTLEALLAVAEPPPKPVHPLARFVELTAEPLAPRVVIPGFIGQGLVVIAGGWGAGKTTCLLPLAMVAAGLHARGDPLAPKHWRHAVYITEDPEQALRIVAGIVRCGGWGLDFATVRGRLHIVEARRLDAEFVAEVASVYRASFARTCDGVEVLPLVVFDTKSSVLAMDEENSNSEASRIVAVLKQDFESLPVWLVGHIAKANMSRSDAAGLSMRGGGAFEADANQVLFLVKEGEDRYLVRGKTRFEAEWPELQIKSGSAVTMARDEFGDIQPVTLRWGIATPPELSRKEAQEQAQEAARKADIAALRDEVRNVIDSAWLGGFPLNREGVKAKVKRNRNEVTDTIEVLLAERWLHEVSIPPKERTNPKRAAFLVNLTTEEHEAALRGEGWPPAKLEVPASWCKPAAPSVSEPLPQEEAGDAQESGE